MHEEFEQLLEAHWEGRLDEAGLRRLEALAASDPGLGRRLAEERRVDGLLRAVGSSRAPRDLASAVFARLDAEPTAPAPMPRATSSRQRPGGLWKRLAWPALGWGGALAAASLLMIEAHWGVLHAPFSSPSDVASRVGRKLAPTGAAQVAAGGKRDLKDIKDGKDDTNGKGGESGGGGVGGKNAKGLKKDKAVAVVMAAPIKEEPSPVGANAPMASPSSSVANNDALLHRYARPAAGSAASSADQAGHVAPDAFELRAMNRDADRSRGEPIVWSFNGGHAAAASADKSMEPTTAPAQPALAQQFEKQQPGIADEAASARLRSVAPGGSAVNAKVPTTEPAKSLPEPRRPAIAPMTAAPLIAMAAPPPLQKRLQIAEVAESARRLEMWVVLPASNAVARNRAGFGGSGKTGALADRDYDPTNGTVSLGDVQRFGDDFLADNKGRRFVEQPASKSRSTITTDAIEPARSSGHAAALSGAAPSGAPTRDDVEAALAMAGGRVERSLAVTGHPGWRQESCALPAGRLHAFLDALHELGLTPQDASATRATVMTPPLRPGILARPTSSSMETALAPAASEIPLEFTHPSIGGMPASGRYGLREVPAGPASPPSQAASGARDAKTMTRLTLIIIQP
jgi:hypothetical protein